MRDLRRSLYRTWLINFRTVDLGKLNNRGMRLTVRLEVWCPWSRTVVPRITEPRMLLLLLPICGRDTSWSDRTFHTSWRICPKFYHFNGNSEIFLARFINASINEPAYNVSRVPFASFTSFVYLKKIHKRYSETAKIRNLCRYRVLNGRLYTNSSAHVRYAHGRYKKVS